MDGEAINRLLVVDDEAAQVEALCRTLEDEGYTIKGFTATSAALEALRSGSFDIVLTDLTMPGMDGIAFLNAAREIDHGIAGIVMTGHGTIATAVEAMKAGALDYILKPFDLRVILRVLARTQAMLRLRRENAALLERLSLRTVELETANRELEVANRELEAFSYSVSHDLRAPVRTIDGLLNVIQEDFGADVPAEARQHIEAASAQATRMGELIEDLLRLSRLGREPLQKRSVDMGALVREVTDELRAAEAARDLEIRIGSLPDTQADLSLLRQVWVNLIANALKFTRRREQALITIDGAEGPEGGRLYSIRDNGAGFDPQRAERLFGIFQRLHGAKEFEGTGVGLSIVRRIIERHGGRIWAEGEPGRGAAFHFTLP
ncbi:MAG TPA: response regulator [Steroidobacteraceae bacterium]|jgi:signal transduction histidine kinase|nr:response regulator [Steroidobacteraceae bacterium]